MDLLCLGEPLVEFNERDDGSFLPGFGGDTSNCAIAAARLGARVGYLGALGADRFGDSIVELWRREGVDASGVVRDPDAPTGIYFVTHDDDGHAFTYYRDGSAASRYPAGALEAGRIAEAKFLHVSGISQAISDTARTTVDRAIDLAREAGTRVSFDTNYRPKLWTTEEARGAMETAIRRADVVLPSVDDARALVGEDDPDAIVDHYLGLGPEFVALTLGPGGALVATRDRRERIPSPAVQAVDATGAGDTFDGALLAALARGEDVFEAARQAVVAAALSTRSKGAITGMPDRASVDAARANPAPIGAR